MDLGSLELQIFVSLTVVLGGAFVALVCDYLKGNNEQLREHNIELRVRKEEQERRLLLDPAGFLGQWWPGSKAASHPATPAASQGNGRTVSAHVLAAPEALLEAETRAANLHARGGGGSFDSADVPPLTHRRSGRIRSVRKGKRVSRTKFESHGDWVRPEVLARVTRKSDADALYHSDIRDELEPARKAVPPEPLNAAENWDIRDQIPTRDKPSVPSVGEVAIQPVPASAAPSIEMPAAASPTNSEESSRLQQEIERVSQSEQQPVVAAPGAILRPLNVPALKLQEEIRREAQQPAANVAVAAMWHSPLLDEVIAASAMRARPALRVTQAEILIVIPAETEVSTEEPDAALTAIAAPVAPLAESETEVSVDETEIEAVEHSPFTFVMDEEPVPVTVDFPVGVEAAVFQNELIEAAEPPPFSSAMDEESAPVALGSPGGLEVTVFPNETMEAVEPPAFTFVRDEESAPDAVDTPGTADEPVFLSEVLEAVEPPPFAFVSVEECAPDAVDKPGAADEPVFLSEVPAAVEPPAFTFVTVEESALETVDAPVVSDEPVFLSEELEAVGPPPFTFVTVEEFAPEAVDTPGTADEPIFLSEVLEAVEPPPFTFVAVEESAPETVDTPLVLDEPVFLSEVLEAVEPPPFTFVAVEESAPETVDTPLVLDEPVFLSEVLEAVEPPPFTFVRDQEPAEVTVVSPVVLEETVFQSDVIDAVEHPRFTFVVDEKSVLVAEVTPVALAETVFRPETIEAVEPPPFAFAMSEEPAPVAVGSPVVFEEAIYQSEETEAMEPPPFTFAIDEEPAPVAVGSPVVFEEAIFQSDGIEAVEPLPFSFIRDRESTPVVAETPELSEETPEAAELPPFKFAIDEEPALEAAGTSLASEETELQSELIDAVDPPSLTFVSDEEPALVAVVLPLALEETDFQCELTEAVEPPPIIFAMDEEYAPVAVATPVVLEEEVSQRITTEAAEPPPFGFVLNEERPQVAEVEPVGMELIAFQDADHTVDPHSFNFVKRSTPESESGGTPHSVHPAPEIETSPERVDAIAASAEAERTSFWLESPIAANEIEDAEPSPAPNIFTYDASCPDYSKLAGMGNSTIVDFLPTLPAIEMPVSPLTLSEEPALAVQQSSMLVDSDPGSLPGLLPLYSQVSGEPASASSEPPPFWAIPAAPSPELSIINLPSPIDISVARDPDPAPIVQAPAVIAPDLLLPTGMHDLSTWTRLLSLPNPMTGILFVITLQSSEAETVPERKGTPPPGDNGPAIDKLMASFVREGDFGTRIAENEWIFIYNHDVAGFNQRRVGMISEKLWDFQLRHLGMANVSFKWGAVDVKSEGLGEAVQAARDRMNQTRRSRKLPGANMASARRVVNA